MFRMEKDKKEDMRIINKETNVEMLRNIEPQYHRSVSLVHKS